MYVLEETSYFWLLAVIPILLFIYLLYRNWQIKTQAKFAEIKFFKQLSPKHSRIKSFVKLSLLLLAIGLLSISLVNPKMGTKIETLKREGIDIVFALDVSKSMLAEDIAPNRLEKSKQIINQIINKLTADRVGLIGYAGSAFPQIPITTDYATTRTFLKAMNTNMVSSQGTAINQAIDLSLTYYNDEQTNKVLVILSDGENHDTNINAITKKAAEAGIKVYTIGVGTQKGAPIPLKENGRVVSYKKDQNNETVITKLNTSTLSNIAKIGNGKYIPGLNTSEAVKQLFEAITEIEKTEFESKQYADYKSQFQWFLGFAILLIILESFIFDKKTAWVQKLNLFNENENDHEKSN
ncbi:MAG: vWA domain-containing protein [Psychroflexus salarius]